MAKSKVRHKKCIKDNRIACDLFEMDGSGTRHKTLFNSNVTIRKYICVAVDFINACEVDFGFIKQKRAGRRMEIMSIMRNIISICLRTFRSLS